MITTDEFLKIELLMLRDRPRRIHGVVINIGVFFGTESWMFGDRPRRIHKGVIVMGVFLG